MNKISYKSKEKLYSTNFQFIKTYNRNPVRFIRQEQYTRIEAALIVQINQQKIVYNCKLKRIIILKVIKKNY